jgi:catechol 2,3-dioxygenase-like lactoylglutathione lyase family enzyme
VGDERAETYLWLLTEAVLRQAGGQLRGRSMVNEQSLPGPFGADVAVTHILVVTDPARSRDFWIDVLGAELYREYGGTSVVLRFVGTWLLLVSAGGPTADKPTVVFQPPSDADLVSHAMTLRVADCRAVYDALRSRGAVFLTPPHDWGTEIRCFLRDPDGHLVEISQARHDAASTRKPGRAARGWAHHRPLPHHRTR